MNEETYNDDLPGYSQQAPAPAGKPSLNPGADENFSPDFDYNAEVMPDPLPKEKEAYHGKIVDFKRISGQSPGLSIRAVISDGVCEDGRTPCDGMSVFMNLWFPKPEDTHRMVKNGTHSVRVSKLRNIKQVASNLKVDLNGPAAIEKAITEGLLLNMPVKLTVKHEMFDGVTSARISSIRFDSGTRDEPVI